MVDGMKTNNAAAKKLDRNLAKARKLAAQITALLSDATPLAAEAGLPEECIGAASMAYECALRLESKLDRT